MKHLTNAYCHFHDLRQMKEQILSGRVLEQLILPAVQSLACLRMFILVSNPPDIHFGANLPVISKQSRVVMYRVFFGACCHWFKFKY